MRGGTDAQRRRFPWHCRYSAIALSYNISQAVFAGTAPLVATAILTSSGGEVWTVGVSRPLPAPPEPVGRDPIALSYPGGAYSQ